MRARPIFLPSLIQNTKHEPYHCKVSSTLEKYPGSLLDKTLLEAGGAYEQAVLLNRLFFAVVMMLLLWPSAFARQCSNSSLKGTYTYAFEASAPGGGPVAAVVGTIRFDGNGGFVGANTQNFGTGQVGPVPFEVTYAVNPDCTYTSEFGGSTQFGIIAQEGEKIRVLNTDSGLLLAFTAERNGSSAESAPEDIENTQSRGRVKYSRAGRALCENVKL